MTVCSFYMMIYVGQKSQKMFLCCQWCSAVQRLSVHGYEHFFQSIIHFVFLFLLTSMSHVLFINEHSSAFIAVDKWGIFVILLINHPTKVDFSFIFECSQTEIRHVLSRSVMINM